MGAGHTQTIRRLIEGSSYSPLPPTDRSDRLKRLAGIDPSPGRDPGVPVRVAYADGTTRNAAMPTVQQDRPNTTLRHRETGADPDTTRLREVRGTVVHPNWDPGAVPGSKGNRSGKYKRLPAIRNGGGMGLVIETF